MELQINQRLVSLSFLYSIYYMVVVCNIYISIYDDVILYDIIYTYTYTLYDIWYNLMWYAYPGASEVDPTEFRPYDLEVISELMEGVRGPRGPRGADGDSGSGLEINGQSMW